MKRQVLRFAPVLLAASLVLGACGADDDGADDAPVTTPDTVPPETVPPDTVPPDTVPPETVPPETLPPETAPPTAPADDQQYETIGFVIEDADGPRLCFEVMESFPPQCGDGPGTVALEGFSWDAIDVEQADAGTTWVDQIYVSGTYDATGPTFDVTDVRIPTPDDIERIRMSDEIPDDSSPCAPPAGGWPERTQDWPADEVAALDGYAGEWSDPSGQVMVVKFTGDLDAAEAAIRELYTDGLCVVAATRSLAELEEIQEQLRSLSSVQILSTFAWVDAAGESVRATTIVPDAALQAAFDEEYGAGTVRLESVLLPVTAG